MARKASITKEVDPRDEEATQGAGPNYGAKLEPELASSEAKQSDVHPESNRRESEAEVLEEETPGSFYERWLEEKKNKGERLRWQAQSMFKAMDLWPIYSDNEEEWINLCENRWNEYHSGRFFMEQLGAERFLHPKLYATLWMLRNSLIEDLETSSAAEEILIDMMMIGYANTLRVQGWVGDLALQIEREFFDEYGLHEHYDMKNGGRHTQKGLWVQGMLERMREQLLPLLDRCNRMTIRNLRAIQELRRGPAPMLAIGRAEQVNVAHQQVNSASSERGD